MQQLIYDTNPHFILRHTLENRDYGSLASDTHYDNTMLMTFLIRGTGHLWVEGYDTQVQEGDLLLLNPREFHRCFFDSHPRHERISIYIHPSIALGFPVPSETLFSAFNDRPLGKWNVISGSILQELHIRQLLLDMKCPSSSDYDGAIRLQCQVIELLLLLKQAVLLMKHAPNVSSSNKAVERTIAHINQHLTEEISTASVADALFLDKSYLCRIFKKQTGATLSEYISKKRIDYALQLMDNGFSCTEACYKSGFNNYSSFYRYYKRYQSENPGQRPGKL